MSNYNIVGKSKNRPGRPFDGPVIPFLILPLTSVLTSQSDGDLGPSGGRFQQLKSSMLALPADPDGREEIAVSTLEDFLNWNIPYLNVTVEDFIIAVIITMIVALVLFYVVLRIIRKSMDRAKFPPLLSDLFARLIKMIFLLVIILVFLSLIGFDISSMVLAFSAIIGLVLAFGMSETVNNFINGVMIAVNRPIEKGEYVIINGHEGTVDDVAMMFTKLITMDNKLVIIPNGKVWGEAIVNFSRLGIRRVEVDFGVAYGSDIGAAMEAALVMMRKHPKVLDEPEPEIFMKDLDDSAIVLQLRPWCSVKDYWPVTHDVRTAVMKTLKETGITIPFPQLDVHMKQGGGGSPPSAGPV